MDYKTLTRDDIQDVFEELLATNGHTTSMEVKEELRKKGYWATQQVVGPALQELAAENEIDFSFNGRYREYQMNMVGSSGTLLPTPGPIPAPKPPKVVLTPDDREPLDEAIDGDWEVTDVKSPGTAFYFHGKMSEGQAKYCYLLKVPGTAYVDVRAKRI